MEDLLRAEDFRDVRVDRGFFSKVAWGLAPERISRGRQ
jgi:hypothetical protein